MPTRMILEDDCLYRNRFLLGELGRKALVVTGKNSARANGAYADAVRALEANGQDHVLFQWVMSNPTDLCVHEAGALARAEGCDFVLAIGGGSPMDAGKAAAVLAVNNIPKEEFFGLAFKTALPLAAVPTTAGTGSETTPYSVLVDTTGPGGKTPRKEGPVKRSVGSSLLFPRLAFLDPKYSMGLNRDITVHTAMDALSHGIEGMLSVRASHISNLLARESIALIQGCLDSLCTFPPDPWALSREVREKLLLASSIAGMAIAQSGTVVPHSMGYLLTLNWGTDHGRANGLLMESFLKWCRAREAADPSIAPRIPSLCSALGMDLDRFCGVMEQLLGKREKATEKELAAWGAMPMKNAANTYIKPGQEDIMEMFQDALAPGDAPR